jgi:excisionase family DNA binding protein
MPSDDEILTIKGLCDLLRTHPSTVYNLARRGQIPGFRVGASELTPIGDFRKDAIERWMTEQTIYAQGVRKVIETGANGEARHRRRAALRRQPGPKL